MLVISVTFAPLLTGKLDFDAPTVRAENIAMGMAGNVAIFTAPLIFTIIIHENTYPFFRKFLMITHDD